MDLVDIAGDLEDLHRTVSLHNQAAKSRSHLPSLCQCLCCGDDIEVERKKLGGVEYCADCANYREQYKRHNGHEYQR